MTFREYSLQCVNYPYSKEYFEFAKLCSELNLQHIYLESQRFMTENTNIAKIIGIGNYLHESADSSDLENINESFREGAAKAWEYIKKKAGEALKMLLSFLSKFIPRLKSEEAKRADLLKRIRDVKLHIEDVKMLSDELKNSECLKSITICKSQPFANSLMLKFDSTVNTETRDELSSLLCAVLSDTVINVESKYCKMGVDDLLKCIDCLYDIISNTNITDTKINDMKKIINEESATIEILIGNLENAQEKLRKINDEMVTIDWDSIISELNDYDFLKQSIATITINTGNLMTIYSHIASYRTEKLNKVSKIVKQIEKKNGKTSDNEEVANKGEE